MLRAAMQWTIRCDGGGRSSELGIVSWPSYIYDSGAVSKLSSLPSMLQHHPLHMSV